MDVSNFMLDLQSVALCTMRYSTTHSETCPRIDQPPLPP